MRAPNKTSSVELVGTILRETDKAIQFEFEDDENVQHTEWFPFSQINEIHRTVPARILVTDWIYGEKVKSWS